jgi:hypothetical protein
VTTTIVQSLDLQIFRALPAVAVVVLDASVGKLHMPIVLRKVVFQSPTMNLFWRSIGSAVAVRSTAIPLLEELLVLAFEFVVEDNATDTRALAA